MSTYKQLTQEQRYQIFALKKAGHGQMEIANIVDVHKSTISRELCRNRGQRGYRPKQAHKIALARRQQTHKRIRPQTWQLITEKLRADWSPEQISGWMHRNERVQVSHPVTNTDPVRSVLGELGRRVAPSTERTGSVCALHAVTSGFTSTF